MISKASKLIRYKKAFAPAVTHARFVSNTRPFIFQNQKDRD